MKQKSFTIILAFTFILIGISCNAVKDPVPGSYWIDEYKGLIEGKTVAIVANQTSMVGKTHLVDTLLSMGMNIKVIFSPEHGFRNMADAGEKIESGKDTETGISLISLYGSHFKPTSGDLAGIDVVIFDIQDVGARFYTYISTLHYVMEACAENNTGCMILDRPNPNGFYYDGNILDTAYRSFVGMHPVPIAHGMTVGEYAQMVNGEGWLSGGIKCDLTVIACNNYTHSTYYILPVKPSPGTSFPFQVYGTPHLPDRGFSFTPESVPGATNPPLLGVKCYGTDLRDATKNGLVPKPKVNLEWVIAAYRDFPDKDKFFTSYFDKLAGGTLIREQIIQGMSAEQIRETWKAGLDEFGKIRSKYLIY